MTVSEVSSIRFDKKTKSFNQSRERDHTKQKDVHLDIKSCIKLDLTFENTTRFFHFKLVEFKSTLRLEFFP